MENIFQKRTHHQTNHSIQKKKGPFFSGMTIQRKLAIGAENDSYEVEADRVADQVVGMSETQVQTKPQTNSLIQRKCAACEEEKVQKKSLVESITPLIQRRGTVAAEGSMASNAITNKINSSKGGGNNMDKSTSSYMESRFGADFSGVRIHTDNNAIQMSKSLNAQAFTVGNDIYFNEGKYNPNDTSGKHLLAHELTHTLQQSDGGKKIQKEDEEGEILAATRALSEDILNELLPVGNGFYYEINGGITWGYPIYTGGSAVVYVNRVSASHMQVIVRKQGRLAFDTGVGGSVMLGRQRTRGSSRNNSVGAGAEAGANFMAGVLGTVIEEFSIPTGDFLPVAVISGVTNLLEMTPVGTLSAPITAFLEANAFDYMRRQRIEAGVFVQADAAIGAGLRRGTDSFNEATNNRQFGNDVQGGASGWRGSGDRNFQGSRPYLSDGDPMALLNFLNLFLSANVNAQIVGGVEQSRNGDTTTSTIFVEGQVGAILGIPIPVVGAVLASLPPNAGAGVELRFIQRPNQDPEIKAVVYLKQGEDQYYAGAAGQQNFVISLSDLLTADQILTALQTGQIPNIDPSRLIQVFEKVTFFNRIVLGGPMGRGFNALIRKQLGTRSLLSTNTLARSRRVYGVNLEAYLDFAAEMSGPNFMAIVQNLYEAGTGAVDEAIASQNFADAYRRLSNYLSGYVASDDFEALQQAILDGTYVNTAKIRIQVGGGTGISARLAEGAKIRGDISVEAGISCELDIAALAGGRITLRSLIPLVEQVIANPIQHIPDCPILRRLFSDGGTGGGTGSTSGSGTISDGSGGASGTTSGNRTSGDEGGQGNAPTQSTTIANSEQSEAAQGSSANASITQNYPPNTPEIEFPILNVRGPISNSSAVGTSMRLRFEIQVPHRSNRIINVPIRVRVVENSDSQIILEVTQTWWYERYRIGSRAGSRYTLEKT